MNISGPDGQILTPRSRKSQALLAVLALSQGGSRSRKWLQGLLWSNRARPQASGSLRSCLHEIRHTLGEWRDVLETDKISIRLDMSRVSLDVAQMTPEAWREARENQQILLEGLDLSDPEFESWLRDEREKWQTAMIANTSGAPLQIRAPAPEGPLALQDWSLSISVLPLINRTNDPSLQFIGEGISEDIIDNLQRVRWLPVIARASSFSTDLQTSQNRAQFAEQLGALYYLDGTITQRRNGLVARLNLIETNSERVLWSETLDMGGPLEESLNEVVSAIARTVAQQQQSRVIAKPDADLGYLDHIWRGRWHMGQFTSFDSQQAHSHFSSALELQPYGPEALLQMGYWHLWGAWVRRELEEWPYRQASALARRAATIDPDDGRCLAIMGTAMFWQQEHDEAETLFRQALELTPSLSLAHQQLGALLLYTDRPEEAIKPMKTAIRYSPRDPLEFGYQTELAAAFLRTGDLEEAWQRGTIGVTRKPRYWYAHLVRILAARRIGDPRRIEISQTGLRETQIPLTVEYLDWLPFRGSEFREELASAIL